MILWVHSSVLSHTGCHGDEMADPRMRLSRIYDVTDLIWRRHMRQLANYEADLQANTIDEANTLARLGCDLPVSLVMTRLDTLLARRRDLCEKIRHETEKAQQARLKLKRLDRRLKKTE